MSKPGLIESKPFIIKPKDNDYVKSTEYETKREDKKEEAYPERKVLD
jgi:hypothetical protein